MANCPYCNNWHLEGKHADDCPLSSRCENCPLLNGDELQANIRRKTVWGEKLHPLMIFSVESKKIEVSHE